MTKGRRKLTLAQAAEQEMLKIGSLALILVVIQLVLSILGFTGLMNTAFMYATATIISNMFTIDHRGILSTKGIYLTPSAHGKYVIMDLLMMGIGVILWFGLGLLNGINTTISHGESADNILKKIAGSNFILKTLYAFISHLTIFAFLRFWVNTYEAIYAIFRYFPPADAYPPPPPGTGRGGRR